MLRRIRIIAFLGAVALLLLVPSGSAGANDEPGPYFAVGAGSDRAYVAPGLYYKQDMNIIGDVSSATLSLKLPSSLIVVKRAPARLMGYFKQNTTPYKVIDGRLTWWVQLSGRTSKTIRLNLRVSPKAKPGRTPVCITGEVNVRLNDWKGSRTMKFCWRIIKKVPAGY